MAEDLPPMNTVPELLLRENRVSDLTLGTIYKSLIEHKGNISACARALEVSRAGLIKKIEGCPALVMLRDEFRQAVIDKAEDNVFADVEKGDQSASKFVLQTIGKDRGYTAGVAGTGKAGEIEVTIRTFAEDGGGK